MRERRTCLGSTADSFSLGVSSNFVSVDCSGSVGVGSFFTY